MNDKQLELRNAIVDAIQKPCRDTIVDLIAVARKSRMSMLESETIYAVNMAIDIINIDDCLRSKTADRIDAALYTALSLQHKRAMAAGDLRTAKELQQKMDEFDDRR